MAHGDINTTNTPENRDVIQPFPQADGGGNKVVVDILPCGLSIVRLVKAGR